MKSLVEKFKKDRWSDTRKAMDAMQPGDVLTLPVTEYFNSLSSAPRLSDAYHPDRHWRVSKKGGVLTIYCTKPCAS